MSANPVVYLVDDDAAIRDSLTFMLKQYQYQLISFESGAEFWQQAAWHQPGCVILDSRMPKQSGQELQQQLIQHDSPLAIIFLTGHGDLPMAVDAFRQGACDFFQKPVNGKELAAAIAKALDFSQRTYEQQQLQTLYSSLSQREQQVVALLIDGNTNKQMSENLCLSLRTIEVHRANAMKKLGVHTMAELVKYTQLSSAQ
ncbi:response regulator transcription factor [Shewanella avicenniae]|uniref:Response regulator transcription factor n=1 Tax=Shewanella avicenniae TaxID=2814294 RepID=A0ABX7QNW4_9GAMM|nr:response regulator [Shewanella avicenniae]QSX33164.1 response regulator transcription factor [Shewanella avicenniae]